jgi:integrase
MSDGNSRRVNVWVQKFPDRPHLMLQWHDPETGKRKSETAGTADEAEAERKRADKEYELNHGLHRDVSRISWERFRERFEEEYVAPCRLNTRRNFQATLDHFEAICGPKRPSGITARTVSLYVAGLRKLPGRARGAAGMMPSTIRVRLQYLHTARSWARSQGMLAEVPEFPAVKVPKKDPQPVPLESFERLVDRAPDANMHAFLLTGWLAGLRLGEALLLEREPTDEAPYLDLARDRIVLPAEYVKAVKDQWVPLDPELRAVLEALPRQGRKVFRFVDWHGKPLTLTGVSTRVVKLARKAGVKLSMKALRRGFGCRYAGKVPAQVLQKLMRHANIKTTMDFYANVDEAAMEAVLGPKRNASRNNGPAAAPAAPTADDVTPCPDGPNSP